MINKFYLKNAGKVKAAFSEKKDFPHVSLFDFLEKNAFASLRKEILSLSFSHEQKPMFHSYSSLNISPALQQKLFSPGVISFLNTIMGRKIIFVVMLERCSMSYSYETLVSVHGKKK